MNLSRLYLLAILILVFSAFTRAQDDAEPASSEDYNRIEAATKISEFGRVGQSGRAARIDNFLIELQNNPGATGYVIFYQGKDVLPSQYDVKGEQLYLPHIKFRNYDESRIVFINAFREHQTTEFWVVPAGRRAPEPTYTIAQPVALQNETLLFHCSHFDISPDDFLLPTVIAEREHAYEEFSRDNGDSQNNEQETTAVSVEKSPAETNQEDFFRAGYDFAEKVKNNSEDRGVVIVYADEKMFDIKKVQNDVRNRVAGLAAENKISPDRFEVVFGGYRHGIEIEMWLVPKAAKTPAAKPAQRQSVAD
jgi:hypothetical protein